MEPSIETRLDDNKAFNGSSATGVYETRRKNINSGEDKENLIRCKKDSTRRRGGRRE